jgi:arylsulfatase
VGKRKEIFYFDAGGNLNALRYDDWKVHFAIIDGNLTTAYRKSPSWPIIVNLRQDPYERAPFESLMYLKWQGEKMWTMVPAQSIVADFLATFKDFPPAKSGSLSVDKVLQQMTTAPGN